MQSSSEQPLVGRIVTNLITAAKETMPSLSVLFFFLSEFIIEHGVFMDLLYQKCMLEEVTIQRTQQFSDFSFLPKNPV